MVTTGLKSGLLMGFGAAAVVVGAVMAVFWPPIFITQLQRMMVLTNESMSFEIWRETPIPMYLEFFFFNITNVDEMKSGNKDIKLKVEQVGPYVFRESHIKTNLTWNDNSTITFYNQRHWYFEEHKSVGSLSDVITSVNPIVVTVGYVMRHRSFELRAALDFILRGVHENMFLSANVSSWIFDGIEDPILSLAADLPDLPFVVPYDKFGWFYGRNGSIEFDGSFNMNTGAGDFSQLGNVEQWRYSNRTDYRDECGAVRGSTGELWAPEYGQEVVYVFSSDLCSFIQLSKVGDVTVQGIDGVRYAANATTFDNGHHYPHMACFCDGPVSDPDCLPPGALNVSQCRFGAPAFVSLPHFLLADPYYPSKIEGLNATEDMNFGLTLEMFTGMPLGVSAQLQINLLVRHYGGLTINNQLPDNDTLVPMFWFRQEMETTEEYAGVARFALRMRYWIPYAFYALTAIGVALLGTGIAVLLLKLLKSSESSPILPEEENTARD
ncbi:unnamed protein product [Arctia plantaginis]|uniref:Uncharacterized protein n=1 Tax=Arctia plantaginis TaxID=874455 RepID=A0A8S0ZX76_ARCPL|nr:unnamed protein product [Arctia plantaginis]